MKEDCSQPLAIAKACSAARGFFSMYACPRLPLAQCPAQQALLTSSVCQSDHCHTVVLMIGYIQNCKITPDLEQLHPSTTTGQQNDTTVPAVMSGKSFLICFLTASSQANLLHLNKCNTLLFTTGLPSTSCKMLSKGFAKAFLSCFLSACQRSLNSNL